jgi:tryptophan synthase beta chain
MQVRNILLKQDEMPRQWYNILADIKLNPPLGPDGNPVKPEDLAPVFPMNLIEQEVSSERWIDIPEEVLNIYTIWRPSPLVRAYSLEKALGTPAKIYYKNESVSPPGSHKPNTSVPQAYYNKVFGIKKSPPKLVRASGEARFLLHVLNSVLNVRYLWSGLVSIRNHTANP